ncbi:polyphosphate kinase 2 family protein [Paenibacillus sp. JX-17]|uniref:Polyphosphate kinase 2 family protein n=1 Tax=Paenibacillus lacisoli TaxID=3064525 RepID=A0ABT9CFT0_9BACL|nr:PPK2 family polyphosphate kinase [Paenibacillus sp. JX-17]MDO7908107.1 polyphosphate kinase 2 family protein [Paenibacillus sp. JX-17]
MSKHDWLAAPDEKIKLKHIDPRDTGSLKNSKDAEKAMQPLREKLNKLQSKLFASKEHAVLFVFQGMDCSGKDGVIKNVFTEVNPQGVQTHSFKAPTAEEASHDFLWRAHRHVPGLGYMAAFNRSYYEDVLVTRVHGSVNDEMAKRNFKHINHFESLLADNKVKVVKIFLHISKDFQLNKLIDRIEKPHKNWKFDENDLIERKSWDRYQEYYEDIFKHCSSEDAPWYIVPADHRWHRDYAVLKIVVDTLEKLDLSEPEPNPSLQSLLPQLYEERDSSK